MAAVKISHPVALSTARLAYNLTLMMEALCSTGMCMNVCRITAPVISDVRISCSKSLRSKQIYQIKTA
jgi:hypothetical protein